MLICAGLQLSSCADECALLGFTVAVIITVIARHAIAVVLAKLRTAIVDSRRVDNQARITNEAKRYRIEFDPPHDGTVVPPADALDDEADDDF